MMAQPVITARFVRGTLRTTGREAMRVVHAPHEGAPMKRSQKSVLLGLVVAVPAAAQAFLPPADHRCFTAGTASYQLSASAAAPDYKVKIDNRAVHPDLRLQLVNEPTTADFVLVDDLDAADGDACNASALRTIRIDDGEKRPDLTISVAADVEAPDFKLYVRSLRFSHEDAAALFGVMWRAERPRDIAARH